jgi:hypothetical protein
MFPNLKRFQLINYPISHSKSVTLWFPIRDVYGTVRWYIVYGTVLIELAAEKNPLQVTATVPAIKTLRLCLLKR